VRGAAFVDPAFHARFSAVRRSYEYRIALIPSALERRFQWFLRHSVDLTAMQKGAESVVGRYAATSWCAAHAPDPRAIVCVESASFVLQGDELIFRIVADRFVTHMVRTIVGTLVEVGRGRRAPENVAELVKAEDRTLAGATAPASGLCLTHVEYDSQWTTPTISGTKLKNPGGPDSGQACRSELA
jgi:tRNA pseudouridine38-40 synthase